MDESVIQSAIKSGLINRSHHAPLLRDAGRLTREAGIPERALYLSMVSLCSKDELEYVRHLPQMANQGVYGLMVEGLNPVRPILSRFNAMAGALLRNYINARVAPLTDVLAALKTGEMEQYSVLLIPDLYLGQQERHAVAPWQTVMLLGLLYNRQAANRQTVVYVESLPAMGEAYSVQLQQHLQQYFITANA